MITAISMASVRIRVEWSKFRWQEADVSVQEVGREKHVVAKPLNLIKASWSIEKYQKMPVDDQDRDGFHLIAKCVIEYMTTGSHLENPLGGLTDGPVLGVGGISALAEILRDLTSDPSLIP